VPTYTRFRRSPHLVCHWDGAVVVLYNYALGKSVRGSVHLCLIVDECREWRSLAQIDRACPGLGRRVVRYLVARLLRFGVLHASGRPGPPAERSMRRLGPWNPAAGYFHTATKDVLFSDRLTAEDDPWRRSQAGSAPAPIKHYRGRPTVRLPQPPLEGEFPRVLLARRTWRRFAAKGLPLEELAVLLGLTGGIQQWVLGRAGRSPLRTSPSGGACQPIDLYVLALRVDGLSAGLYHYACDRHQLERLGRARRGGTLRYLPEQYWYEDAAVLVLFAASFDRTLRRYKYARAYRAVLIEAGHLCQTFCLTATWRGLAPFCSLALADSKVDGDLGLDGISESVLYVAGVGLADGSPAESLAPRDVVPPRVVPNPIFAFEAGAHPARQRPS
jgi:SagB-type dehydrogenase family enzyme